MKKIIIALALFAATGFYQETAAQVRVNINIGTQPIWGPTGYDYAPYYYLPELDVYYDVQNRLYYYQNRNRWISAAQLPVQYSRYNLYITYKVVLNESRPWLRNKAIRGQYAGYRNRHDQVVIRDSRDVRYWENAQHPRHNDWLTNRATSNRSSARAQANTQPQREGHGSSNAGRNRR